ncbi:hypothetical protein OC845_005409 [Tilletia horrida]|nr:hypothetical protein OC845_005409 [Tilletia horrida]
MVELPTEIWYHVIRAASESERSCVWMHGPLDHPAVALSQTCKTLRGLAAPFLWRDVTVTNYTEEVLVCVWRDVTVTSYVKEVLVRLKKLTISLKDPLAKKTIQRLHLDLGGHFWFGIFERSAIAFRNPTWDPRYTEYLTLMTQLGKALAESPLHIHLVYDEVAMPWGMKWHGITINGSDPLHLLSQVRSATIGMGDFLDPDQMRTSDAFNHLDLDKEYNIPYLISWLRGNLPGSSSGRNHDDNALVNLKTNAPFLYRCRALIPAWARFNLIQEMVEMESKGQGGCLPYSERDLLKSQYREMETDIRYARAAMALRPSLDRLVEGRQSGDVTAAEVVRMIRMQDVFVPWRSEFFPRTQLGDTTYDASLALAEEILHHWRKSEGSRRADPGPCERWLTGSWPV